MKEWDGTKHWSLSEFLNLLDVRGLCWGLVEIGVEGGFRVRANETVLFYAILEGTCTVSSPGGQVGLSSGDTLIITSGKAHAVRTHPGIEVNTIRFLNDDAYCDTPHQVVMTGPIASRVLCGRLKVRWPGGLDPNFLPNTLKIESNDNVVDLQALVEKSKGYGASALLTRAATLILTSGLRDHPQCQTMFRDSNFRDPISRAIQMMEKHSHQEWTVADLAAKVGLGRSTFAERFLAQVGKPPMEMLTAIRMQQAAKLLTETPLKVAEIGERVGYHSHSAFNRRFEDYFKVTPAKMRAYRRGDAAPDERGIPNFLAGPPDGDNFQGERMSLRNSVWAIAPSPIPREH